MTLAPEPARVRRLSGDKTHLKLGLPTCRIDTRHQGGRTPAESGHGGHLARVSGRVVPGMASTLPLMKVVVSVTHNRWAAFIRNRSHINEASCWQPSPHSVCPVYRARGFWFRLPRVMACAAIRFESARGHVDLIERPVRDAGETPGGC